MPTIFLILFDHVKYQGAYPFPFSSALIAKNVIVFV